MTQLVKSPTLEDEMTQFIRAARCNETSYTHVLLGTPYGKLQIGKDVDAFWRIYSDCVEKKVPLYFAESPSPELPILVDVDLKTKKNYPDDKLYSQQQVLKIVSTYQSVLSEILENIKPEALTCVLLEKPPYKVEFNNERYIKNGFHLHFPKLFVDVKVQEAYVIPLVQKELKGMFDELTTDPMTGNLTFIDDKSIKVHWLMYGSQKPNNVPYVATKCFADGATEISFEKALGDYVLPKLRKSERATCFSNVEYHLPRILSTKLYARLEYYYKSKPSISSPIIDLFVEKKKFRTEFVTKSIQDTLQEASNLLKLISVKRADDRGDWLAIGFCLWNITDGDEEGLYEWMEFSDNSHKFNEAECICLWKNMRKNNFTIGTLKYFAKQDSPHDYETIFKSTSERLLFSAIDGGHNDLAKILYNAYGDEFCFSTVDDTWYVYSNHIWSHVPKCFALRERISNANGVIIQQFNEFIYKLLREAQEFPEQRENYTKKITAVKYLIKQCKSTSFKSSVLTECSEVFRNDIFYDRLNTDPYLIAFSNGVYDFKNDKFRPGKPEDYLSVSIPVEYKDYGSTDHPDVSNIVDFFRTIFPDPDLRNYFLDQVCHVFIGGNPKKKIFFWTGVGDNGKTITSELFEMLLGKLAIKFQTTLITGKKQLLGNASPEMARAGNGVRWAVMDEPEKTEVINAGILKQLTGNDSYWARDLFQKGKEAREIKPLFKLIMICNVLPTLIDADSATWERIRVIPFETKFLPENKCPTSLEERMNKKIFPMDEDFRTKMPDMLQPLAWFLINRWRYFNKLEHIEPEKVKIATSVFKQDNDTYDQFVQEMLDTHNEQGKLTTESLYENFKDWFKTGFPGRQIPTKNIVVQFFSNAFQKPPSGKIPSWFGVSLKSRVEENNDNPLLRIIPNPLRVRVV